MASNQYAFITFRAVALCIGIGKLIAALTSYLWPTTTYVFGMGDNNASSALAIGDRFTPLLRTNTDWVLTVLLLWFGARWLSAWVAPRGEEMAIEPGSERVPARDILIPVFVIVGVMMVLPTIWAMIEMLDAWYSPNTFTDVMVRRGSVSGMIAREAVRMVVGLLLMLRPQWGFALLRWLGAALTTTR